MSTEEGWWDTDKRKGKAPPRLESSVEKPVVAYAKRNGVLIRKMNGAGFRGWPDRLFIFPNGRQLWIEFKAPGKLNNLSTNQEQVIAQLRWFKQEVAVIDDIGKGKVAIDAYLLTP